MGLKLNPLTAQFDLTGSGGGSSYIDGEVATYNDLPLSSTTAPLNTAWLVRGSSGVWPFTKPGGVYVRTATGGSSRDADYTYAGIFPDVFSDANFTLYDDADSTKNAKFQLSAIATGTTRTISVPNKSITLDDAADARDPKSHIHAASDITSGTLDNARVNFAAPSAIGSTTPSSGSFTTLSANNATITASAPAATISQTWNASGTTFTGFLVNPTDTASAAASLLADFQTGGTSRFRVRKDGEIQFPTTGNISMIRTGQGLTLSTIGGGTILSSSGPIQANGAVISVYDGFVFGSTTNTVLLRDGADHQVAFRSGTNAQTFRLYSTYTSATSFERLNIAAQSAGSFILGTEKGSGGGSARGLELRTDNTARLTFGASGTITLNTTLAADAQNISTDATTGTKIGTGATQKIGFWNATPAAQPAAVADATDAASTQARLNDLLARLRTIGIIAT